MTTFSIEVPDDQVQLVAEAFAQQRIMDTPQDSEGNDLTGQPLIDAQIEFARQQCIAFVNDTVRHHLVWKQAQEQAAIPVNPVNLT